MKMTASIAGAALCLAAVPVHASDWQGTRVPRTWTVKGDDQVTDIKVEDGIPNF